MSEVRSEPHALWGERSAPAPGETVRLEVGPLTVWIRAQDNELWIASVREAGPEEPQRSLTDGVAWSRWALPAGCGTLRITPAFPDRPLVVKPEHAFTLVRRASARIYMRVPVWVRIEVVERDGRRGLLTEIPTVILSETWWGDFRDGELAYWLVTKGRTKMTDELFLPHLVISAVQMDNLSDDDLAVEKHILRTEHLSIYQKAGHLWAEEVRIEYRGEVEGTEIHMDDRPPREADGAVEISPARHQGKSFKARTFERLKALSGWGG